MYFLQLVCCRGELIRKFRKNALTYSYLECVKLDYFNPRSLVEKIVTRSLEGGGGKGQLDPPSTFNTIHPIDLKFGT